MDREAIFHDILERILLDESEGPTQLPIGLLESITNGFSDAQKIGSGGFADVYKGELQSGIVAVKKLKVPGNVKDLEVHEKNFIREVDSLMKVKHKNIVRVLGYCFDTQGQVCDHKGKNIVADEQQRFFCFEFLPRGSLHNHISDASSGLDWSTRYHIIKGICEGLHYLHGMNIVHSDLKPQNILLDYNMVPKIGDFGLARSFLDEQTRTATTSVHGTLGYMAPEYFRGEITYKTDIYGLGIIIKEILNGKKDDLSIENVQENWILRFKTSHGGTWLEHVTVCAEIYMSCMEFDPKKRPTIEHIIDTLTQLEHKYGFIEMDHLATHVPSMDMLAAPSPLQRIICLQDGNQEESTELIRSLGSTVTTKLLDVYPLELRFPPNQVDKCPLTLTNKTAKHVGIWMRQFTLDYGGGRTLMPVRISSFNEVDDEEEYDEDTMSLVGDYLGTGAWSWRPVILDPHSTAVLAATLESEEPQKQAQQQDPAKFELLMIVMESKQALRSLNQIMSYSEGLGSLFWQTVLEPILGRTSRTSSAPVAW